MDKDQRTSNWALIFYRTCTTIELNCMQELNIVYSVGLNYEFDRLMFVVYQIKVNDWIKMLDVRIQKKSPHIIFSLASLGFGGKLGHCSLSIFPLSY